MAHQDNKTAITIVLGKRGSGKSTLAKRIFDSTRRENFIVCDYLGEYNYGNVLTSIFDTPKVCKNKKINITMRNFDETDFNALCNIAWLMQDLTFLIDEADSMCSSSYISDSFAMLIRYGRHKNIDIIGVSRRPPDLPRLLTSQANKILVAKFQEPRDVKYIQSIDSAYNPLILKDYEFYSLKI